MKIALDARRTARFLSVIVGLLLVAHLMTMFSLFVLGDDYLYGFVRFFHLDQEPNIPTLFSTLMLLFAALILAAIGAAARRAGDRFAFHWTGLALLFLFLAFDEGAAIHEEIGYLLVWHIETTGLLYYRWIIPYSALVLVVLLLCARFLRALPARTRNLFLAAGMIYVTGAIGLEAVGGSLHELDEWRALELHRGGPEVERGLDSYPAYGILATFEELFEMVGVVVFIYALLAYAATRPGGLRVTISLGDRAPPP